MRNSRENQWTEVADPLYVCREGVLELSSCCSYTQLVSLGTYSTSPLEPVPCQKFSEESTGTMYIQMYIEQEQKAAGSVLHPSVWLLCCGLEQQGRGGLHPEEVVCSGVDLSGL